MRMHRTHEVIAPWSTGAPVLDRGPPRRGARRTGAPAAPPAIVLDICLAAAIADHGDPGRRRRPRARHRPRPRCARVSVRHAGDDAFAAASAGRVLPHLETLAFGGGASWSTWSRFAPCAGVRRRAATPAASAPRRCAKRSRAWRRTGSRAVSRAAAPCASTRPTRPAGWAMLRDVASAGRRRGRRRVAAELAWYGDAPAPRRARRRRDRRVATPTPATRPCVVRLDPDLAAAAGTLFEAIDPLPLDVAFSFDPAEGSGAALVRRRARARAPFARRRARRTRSRAGGSSGRIAVVLGRADWAAAPVGRRRRGARADRRAASRRLRRVRRRHGATSCAAPTSCTCSACATAAAARAIVDAARRDGVPWRFTPTTRTRSRAAGGAPRSRATASSTAPTSATCTLSRDARAPRGRRRRRARGRALCARVGRRRRRRRRAARRVRRVRRERRGGRRSRARTGRRGPIEIVPPLLDAVGPVAVAASTGADPFVLAHAPIGPLRNQLLLARCALDADLPLVLAGPGGGRRRISSACASSAARRWSC